MLWSSATLWGELHVHRACNLKVAPQGMLNVMKEEVPSERRSPCWAFASGMVAYTVLLLTF